MRSQYPQMYAFSIFLMSTFMYATMCKENVLHHFVSPLTLINFEVYCSSFALQMFVKKHIYKIKSWLIKCMANIYRSTHLYISQFAFKCLLTVGRVQMNALNGTVFV